MLFCLSVSHKKASLPMLESLAFPDEGKTAKDFCSQGILAECVILQTCHRVEVYGVTEDTTRDGALNKIVRPWSLQARVSDDILNKVVDQYEGKDALAHLFSLAAGLESMVVGEDQILGQVRKAFVKGKNLGSVGCILGKSFMKAVNIGRRIRTETKINEGSVSISSAAVDLAAKILGDLKSANALVVGAGEAGSVAAETLRRRGIKSIFIANRTFDKGLELASKVSGKAVKFSALYDIFPKVDVVIVATSVSHPILKAKEIEKALEGADNSKRLCLIDISQPRAVEEKASLVKGLVLRNIEDLKEIVEESVRNREVEAATVKRIVLDELERFQKELSKLMVEPLVSEIYRKVEQLRQKELERAIHKMAESDSRKLAILDRFSRELVERIVQTPVQQLNEAALEDDRELFSAAGRLFKIQSR